MTSKKFIIFTLIFVSTLSLIFSTTTEAKQRFNQVSIFNDDDTTYEVNRLAKENISLGPKLKILDSKYVVYARRFLSEYFSYFSGNFLIGYSARPYRYATPGSGLITYVELVLFAIGLLGMAKRKKNFLPLLLLLIAPLPAAVTTEDAPNLSRAFLMVPFLVLIEAYAVEIIWHIKKNTRFIILTIFALLIANFSLFLYMYFVHSYYHKPFIKDYVLDGSSYRNVGAKNLVLEIDKIKNNYDKIVLTNSPDDPYPWYAFFTNKDPKEFNLYAITRSNGPWQYKNIEFSQLKCPSDSSFKTESALKLLVVDAGAPDCAYDSEISDGLSARVTGKIFRPSGSEVYTFIERK